MVPRIGRPRSGLAAPLAVLTAITVAFGGPTAGAADWPSWRGPARDGTTAEQSGWGGGAWLAEKPAWAARVGEGSTSPIVVAGKLYTMGWSDGKDRVHCLDAANGELLWTVAYDCPQYGRHSLGDKNVYSGPTATPEYDPATGFLYTLSTDGHLNCWDTGQRGKRVWGMNLYDTYGAPQRPKVGEGGSRRDYGYITAPLVHGDWLVVAVGAQDGNLMAFDKRDGKRKWVSECKDPAGHCGGLAPIKVKDIPGLAVLTLRNLVVVRLDAGHEGKTLAQYEWVTDFGNNIATPAVRDNFVLVTSAYNHGAICKLEITPGNARKVWEQAYSSGACSPVIAGGHVYWTSERMYCLDFATGKLKWQGGSFGSPGSCVVTADDKLVVWGGRGRLALVEPAEKSPDRYRELARLDRLAATEAWPHVAVAAGKLYCKDRDGNVKAFRLAGGRGDPGRSRTRRVWAWRNYERPNSLLNSATVRMRVLTMFLASSRSLSPVLRKSARVASAAAKKGASLGSRGKSIAVGGLPTFTVRIVSNSAQRPRVSSSRRNLGRRRTSVYSDKIPGVTSHRNSSLPAT